MLEFSKLIVDLAL